MFYNMFERLVTNLSTIAYDKWNSKQEFINARLTIRDRLKREARLNAELLKNSKGNDLIIEELSIIALQEVFNMPIPLPKIMDKPLSTSSIDILKNSKKYEKWTKSIETESDLLERLWQRTRMMQINTKHKHVKPDLRYLRILNRALVDSLSVKDE